MIKNQQQKTSTYFILVSDGGNIAMMVHRKAELVGLLASGGEIVAMADIENSADASRWFKDWCTSNFNRPINEGGGK